MTKEVVIATVEVDLKLPGILSLKEKRHIIKPLIARLQSKFNVSVAEVDYNDNSRMARIGAAVVSNEKKFCEQVIAKLVAAIEQHSEVILIDYRVEVL